MFKVNNEGTRNDSGVFTVKFEKISHNVKVLVLLTLNKQISVGLRLLRNNPANIYLFKVKNRSIKKSCEICSKLRIKTP